MKPFNHILLAILLGCSTMPSQAQEADTKERICHDEQCGLDKILATPIPHKYKFWDNLFFGGSVGLNYSLSEYVRNEKFANMLRPQADVWLGKSINKALAARVGLFLMSQEASIPKDVQALVKECEPYNFCMVGTKADLMFNLNRLFLPYSHDEMFQLWAVGGVNAFRTFSFQDKVRDWDKYYPIERTKKVYGGGHVGLEAQLRQGDHYSLILSGMWHRTSSSYNGRPLTNGSERNYVTLNIGFVYRFTNSKGEIGFHNCRHNENYYFDETNRRINKYYKKLLVDTPTLNDSVILFPRHYAYLTPLQKDKIDRLLKRMEENSNMHVQIDVYSDGDESSVYNQFRASNRRESIHDYIEQKDATLLQRISITHHSQVSPLEPDHDWSRAGIIQIENN